MELIDPQIVSETFCDGISEVKIIDGIVRIVAFSRHDSVGVIGARLALPLSELPDVIQRLVIALTEAARAKPSGNFH